MSFDIAVKVDPGNSVQTIKKVEDGLHAAEKAAKEMRDSMASAARVTSAVWEREASVLQMATGRSKDHYKNLAALENLYHSGRVTQEQYIRTLDKLGQKFDDVSRSANANAVAVQRAQSQQAMNTIGFSNAPKPVGGMSMGSAMAGLGAAGAGVAALEARNENIKEAEHQYGSTYNAALKFADGERTVNQILKEQSDVAAALHVPLAETLSMYDSIKDATQDLNLSHREQIDLQEQLGRAAISEGKAIGAAGEIMNRLRVAFDSGADAGKLLKLVMLDYGDLADSWIGKFGGTEKAFLDMVKSQKVGLGDLVDVTIEGNAEANKSWNDRIYTEKEWATKAQESAQIAQGAGENVVESMITGIKRANDAQRDSGITFVEWGENTAAQLKRIGVAADSEINGKLAGALLDAADAAGKVTSGVAGIADALMSDGFFALVKAQDPWFVKPETPEKIKKVRKEFDLLADIRARLAAEYANGREGRAEKAMFDKLDASGMAEQTEREREIFEREKAAGTGGSAQSMEFGGINIEKSTSDWDQVKKDQDEVAIAAEQAAAKYKEAWADAAGSALGDLLRMTAEGEMSVSEMVTSILRKLAMVAIQQAAVQMGGPYGAFIGAAASAFGGGKDGFDYVANSNALQLPGFAHGGDMLARGSGSQDSQLAAFRISAGESIHVRTPQQRMAEESFGRDARQAMRGGRQGGRTVVNVITPSDPREVTAAFGTYEGERAVARLDRRRGFARRRSG